MFSNTTKSIHQQSYELADYNGMDDSRSLKARDEQHVDTLPMSIVDFDLNSTKLNTSIPPTASDVALILEELRNDGAQHIHFSTQFHREESEGVLNNLVKQVFSSENSPPFKSVLIPLQFTRSAIQEELPEYLKRSGVPITEVIGNTNTLPTVNKVIHSPVDGVNFSNAQDIPSCVKFGFTALESEQAPEGKTFLLARWNDHIILHQLILSTMALAEVDISDLTIELGQFIKLGKDGPTIAIDNFGCATITLPEITPPASISADSMFDDEVEALANGENPDSDKDANAHKHLSPHVLITSTDTDDISIQLVDQPYVKLHGLFQTPEFNQAVTYFRLPRWLEACILVEFTLICASFYTLRGGNRHLAYSLLLVSLWPLSVLLLSSAGYWMPISPVLTIIIAGWAVSTYLSTKWNLRRPTTTTDKDEKKRLTRFD